MFFYISFLRPPPYQAHPDVQVTITPQVANDLRTELCTGTQDIYYTWLPATDTGSTPQHPIAIPRPVKLTTWRESNAYRTVAVPPPQGAKEGTTYRLILTALSQGYPYIVNLASPTTGDRPFPVLSMPMTFSSWKPAAAASKQERVERVYRLCTDTGEQAFLSIKEQTSFDLDKKVWDSGIGLSSWIVGLLQNAKDSVPSPLLNDLRQKLTAQECKVIELGAGTGIVSLALGAIRSLSKNVEPDGCIITTDLASAMPLLEKNISENKSLFRAASVTPKALVLDWDDEVLPPEVLNIRTGFDVIVLADVTYNTASFPSLIRTLQTLVQTGDPDENKKSPLVLLGYKERDVAERSLWGMAADVGITLDMVGERQGAGGKSVEIWLGSACSLLKSGG